MDVRTSLDVIYIFIICMLCVYLVYLYLYTTYGEGFFRYVHVCQHTYARACFFVQFHLEVQINFQDSQALSIYIYYIIYIIYYPLRSGPEPRTRELAFPGAEAVAVTSCRLLPVSFEVQDAGHVPF